MPKQAIQAHATAIDVPYLVHFTRAVNLPSILAHGLYPIGRVCEIGATPRINDVYRLDGYRNGTCVSVGFPNCQMFYKYRMDEPQVEWAILALDPAILWVKDCAFCCHNAADGRISSQTLENLKTVEAFKGLYDEFEAMPTRKEQNLKSFDPTDVQAEALVFDVIEPQCIGGIAFEKASVRDTYLPYLAGRTTRLDAKNKGLFASRNYARTWGN